MLTKAACIALLAAGVPSTLANAPAAAAEATPPGVDGDAAAPMEAIESPMGAPEPGMMEEMEPVSAVTPAEPTMVPVDVMVCLCFCPDAQNFHNPF